MDHEQLMRQALLNAKKAYDRGEVPVGALIVFKNEIITEGYNLVETHNCSSSHAEMLCLNEAQSKLNNWRLSDCILYTTLEPCLMCYGASILARVKKIVYGANDLRHGACGGCFHLHLEKHPIHPIELLGGVLREESQNLLKKFFKGVRKNKEDAL